MGLNSFGRDFDWSQRRMYFQISVDIMATQNTKTTLGKSEWLAEALGLGTGTNF